MLEGAFLLLEGGGAMTGPPAPSSNEDTENTDNQPILKLATA